MTALSLVLLTLLAADRPLDAFDYADTTAARQAWKAAEGTPPVESVAQADRRVLRLDAPFQSRPALVRAVIDKRVSLDLRQPGEFRLALSVDNPAACSRFTLYFRSGDGWYGCGAMLPEDEGQGTGDDGRGARDEGRGVMRTLVFKKASFGTEGEPAGWGKIDGVRISVWKTAAEDASIRLLGLTAVTHEIALVVPDGKPWEAGGEKRLSHEQAAAMAEMLGDLGLGCDVLPESSLAEMLPHHRLAILAYNPGLSRAAEDALIAYVENGGKVFVCYQLPERLGKALGFGNAKYVRQQRPGQFAEIRFDTTAVAELPRAARQASWNFTAAEPIGPNAQVVGRWHSDDGHSTGHAAVLLSDRGAFFSHIVLGDDRSAKRRMLAALVGKLWPAAWSEMAAAAVRSLGRVGHCRELDELVEHLQSHGRQWHRPSLAATSPLAVFEAAQSAHQQLVDLYLQSAPSRSPEGRAVWNHSGTGAFAGDWDRSAKLLADNGFNMVIPNMLWGGLAHYASDLLPRSETFRTHGDQIEQCCKAAKAHGLEVHVWKVNFNLSTAPKSFVNEMRAAGRTQVTVKGEPHDWLCPSHPENQKLERESMLEVARKYPVAGLHFDYIRYPGRDHCYCDGCRERFEKDSQKKVAQWPADCYTGPRKAEYHDWRCRQITALVEAVSREARRLRPEIKISAAVFGSYPDCRESVGQDWPVWARAGYVDFLCPMDYTPDDGLFKRLVRKQLQLVEGRVPLYPGIGATASRMALAPDRVVGQVHWARQLGAAGFTVFDFGPSTAEQFVPAIGLGAGRQKAAPPHAK